MEYELFQSKLKSSVNRALISNIIESSSSGDHPHHPVAIGLILERSIQGRHKRALEKVKNTPQSTYSSQPEKGTKTPIAPVPPGKPIAPSPQSSSSSVLTTASTKTEAPPNPPTLSMSGIENEVDYPKEYPTDTKTIPPCEHTVKLACGGCGAIMLRPDSCPRRLCKIFGHPPKCASCGIEWATNAVVCTHCRGTLKW